MSIQAILSNDGLNAAYDKNFFEFINAQDKHYRNELLNIAERKLMNRAPSELVYIIDEPFDEKQRRAFQARVISYCDAVFKESAGYVSYANRKDAK